MTSGGIATRKPAVLGGTPRFAQPLYVMRARRPTGPEFVRLVESIFDARWFTNNGALVLRLEEALRARLGAGFCASFCNGTTALQAALRHSTFAARC